MLPFLCLPLSPSLCALSGLQCSPADSVAVGEPAVCVCGAAPQRQHGVLPGEAPNQTQISLLVSRKRDLLLTDSSPKISVFTFLDRFLPKSLRCVLLCLLCQFMSDARNCDSYLRQLQDTIKRQYTCDKNSRLSKLEDLLQDSMVPAAPSAALLRYTGRLYGK